ncbi:hypothetical protein [Microbacterium sp. GXF6406]
MAIKHTPLSAQNELTGKVEGFHARANATREAYYAKREEILRDDRLSDTAKVADLAELTTATNTQLQSIKGEQQAYVSGLIATLTKELYGNQPTDANSIMLRRDARERARKIETQREALEALRDAVNSGDESMAHAIGTRGRDNVWLNVADAWKEAFPSTAGVAEALHYVEGYTSDGAYNLANSMAYASPAE